MAEGSRCRRWFSELEKLLAERGLFGAFASWRWYGCGPTLDGELHAADSRKVCQRQNELPDREQLVFWRDLGKTRCQIDSCNPA